MATAGRALTACGTAACTVVSRAIISDVFDGAAALRSAFALFTMASQLSPSVAPLPGAAVQQRWGWRACFVAVAAATALHLVAMARTLHDPPPPGRGCAARRAGAPPLARRGNIGRESPGHPMHLFGPLRHTTPRRARLLWLALVAFACAPLVWATQPVARAIDVPFCSADALTHGPQGGATHEAPLHGRIVLVFSASAGATGTNPHAAPVSALTACAQPRFAPIGAAAVAAARPPSSRGPSRPPARAPPAFGTLA